ncbi:MAG: sigma-70 family RNA polymerase sigma factor [Dehalococcoidia bacterium]|nr:sigma-70 family RNA polymerase sigma factor [Dehalococcoidia bacterium]
MDETDLNLVKRSRNGDRDAFRILVERHQRRVFGLCFGMVRNKDDAMDLVQETFVKVFKNLDSFEGQSSFYTWTYRIATNVCIDFLRRANRYRTVDYDDAIQRDEDAEDAGSILPSRLGLDPARVYGRKELLEKIEEALQKLSPAHRQAILLREVEGLSYQEMADVLEISIGTVMSRLHHARKNMQRLLADYVGNKLEVDR